MPAIKLEQFGGMLPAWDPHLLPNGQSASATNAYVFSGGLIGWRQPKLLHTLTNSAAKFAYRIPVVTTGTATNTLTFKSNPNVGDTVTVGEMTYTFANQVPFPTPPPAMYMPTPYTVLIGATPNDTAQNFINALTLDQGKNINQGDTYGDGTSPNPSVDQFGKCTVIGASNQAYVQAALDGLAYNTTIAAESTGNVRLSWATTPTFTGGTNSSFDPTITGAALWMEFLDPDTTVLRSPIVDDQYNRYYWASPSQPPQYNPYSRIAAGQPAWLLGINPPGCAPLVKVTSGGDTAILGNQLTVSSNFYTPGGNSIFVTQVTPLANMTIIDCAAVAGSDNPLVRVASVLYSDNNGKPDILLGSGEPVTGVFNGSTFSSIFLNPVGVIANVPYWIGFMIDLDQVSIAYADDIDLSPGYVMTNTFTNGPAGVFSATNKSVPDLQMWADFTTSTVLEARAYVYTWLTEYGEESAPSPGTLVNGWSNGIWTVEMWAPPAEDMGVLRNIKKARLYRTVPATSGQTVFYWVCDLDIASNTITDVSTAQGVLHGSVIVSGPGIITDTQGDDVVALNNQLASTTWFPPPEGLEGIYNLPNGMIVGFRGNEIWFCEPYRPHAWPPQYTLTTEFPIIGLGVAGTAVIAVTGGAPYVGNGVNPTNMAMNKLSVSAPGLPGSRGAIISGGGAVFYPSLMGLMQVDPNTQVVINTTELWITRDKWAQLAPQKNLRAVLQNSCYFAFGFVNGEDNSTAQTGFTIELNTDDAKSFTIWPQPGGHRLGFGKLTAPNGFDINNIMNDPWTGITLVVQNAGVYYYDFTDAAPVIVPYDWTSKVYQQKHKENFSAMRVYFSIPPNTPPQNSVRNTTPTSHPSWNTLNSGQYGIVYVYGDGNLITTREIVSNGELLRIGSGQKYEEWQWRVQGRVLISNIQVATTVKELKNV